MDEQTRQREKPASAGSPVPRVKLVAELPEDEGLEQRNEEMQKNDGYPSSCGI